MFSLQIVDTDAFLEMPISTQLLYFHLVMRADDEGFVGSPKKIMKMVGLNDDDLKVLIGKRFVLSFDSGVVVVKHWLIHNTIRMDRLNPTTYSKEKKMLTLKENKAYTEGLQPDDNQMTDKCPHKLSKVKLSKVNLIKESVAKAITPSEEARTFFETKDIWLLNKNWVEKIKLLTTEQKDFFGLEINKFVSYWTEPSKAGTQQRWEQQKTFEINRRLATWMSNCKQFNNLNDKKITLNL